MQKKFRRLRENKVVWKLIFYVKVINIKNSTLWKRYEFRGGDKPFTGFQKLKLIVVKFAFNSERKFVEIRVRQHELSQKAELY